VPDRMQVGVSCAECGLVQSDWFVQRERELLADLESEHGALVESEAELERLRARLCYVNPDGSHVRGCVQHEAQHPAQWCEALAHAKGVICPTSQRSMN
jgi:hypothetical protein